MSIEIRDTPARIAAPFHYLRRSIVSWQAGRREADALRRAGWELANSPVAAADDRLRPFFAALSRHQARLDTLAAALAKSIERERADCASVAPWLRPLVVLRGLAERALLHYQLQQFRREMSSCHEALGRAARGHSGDGAVSNGVAPGVRDPHSPWLYVATNEGQALGAAVWHQLHGKLVPRVSALAGLAAGWWVASTYTDSHLTSILNTVGIGRGGTHVVSGATYRAMSFWLPILAAATCAYLGDRLARAIRSRHETVAGISMRQDP